MRLQDFPKLAWFVISLAYIDTSCLALDVQPESGSGWTHKQAVTAEKFMVSAAHPLAAETGYDVLRAGGTAVDAAVAVQLVLNLVEPQSSGIGGGAFMLHWDAKRRELSTIDGRETAPAAARPVYFLDENGDTKQWWATVTGGGSVGVPGTLKLLALAHQRYGGLAWGDLFESAIELADSGFEVTPRLATSITQAKAVGLDRFDATRSYFFNDDGSTLAAGAILKNPEFADTLRIIAEGGAESFYRGQIAEDIVNAVRSTKDNPGLMTLEDLATYEAKFRRPVCSSYRSYQVCGMGPPSSGALTVGQILGMLNHFDMRDMGLGVDTIHLYSEAAKLAYADRAMYMADSDYVRMPMQGLLDPAYLTFRAQLIKLDRVRRNPGHGNPPWQDAALYAPDNKEERPGTSHFSIVDRFGNAVSMTTTIETGFGSRVMVGGFLLNNELTDFSWEPEKNGRPVANRVEGGKRPRSSMSPTIVFKPDGAPYLLLGSPGGSRIINYVAKTLIAILDWDMDIQEAMNVGHFVSRNGPIDIESGTIASEFTKQLQKRGHEVNVRDLNSGLHGIMIKDELLVGGADPRREGVVMGD
ncbi:MAG: gamma-glutamyltransferase [Gammaproteobacteria bacterium]|nr:gamma-glutamyltransferase [Gammaproteobacteria bacterium]